jgi:hypothetical protein
VKGKRAFSAAVAALGVAVTVALLPATPAHAFAIYFVTNVNDAGAGSLRAAINNANGTNGLDAIFFNIPGAGPHVIAPLADLPDITDPVLVAGYTEPGAAPAAGANPATLTVVIDGINLTHGLLVNTDNSSVAGLVVQNVAGTGGTCGGAGICVTGDHNVIRGNHLGVDVAGAVAQPNNGSGLKIEGDLNIVGGGLPEHRNVISGNNDYGVDIVGVDNTIQGNYIGIDATGVAAIGNGIGGVVVDGGATLIGGDPGAGNVISGNAGIGLQIDNLADASVVKGNLIGTNYLGTAALANTTGLDVSSDFNQIGGTAAGARNVISGNSSYGISINGVATDNKVEGNLIGVVNVAGMPAALGNGNHGVYLPSNNRNSVGGHQAGAGNVIAANAGDGVHSTGNDHRVEGNLIGVVKVGGAPVAMGNVGDGVSIDGDVVTVGGSDPLAGNLIGGNGGNGVLLGLATDDSVVVGNFIGLDPSGNVNLANAGAGVWISGDTNMVGTDDPAVTANYIANNAGGGVLVDPNADDNAILRNTIVANNGLGIDLDAAGVLANDAQDPDVGANDLQNYPTITSAVTAMGVTTITWGLDSVPMSTFHLEFFVSNACDASGNGEGTKILGDATAMTPAVGQTSGTTVTAVAANVGQVVVATATLVPAGGGYESTSEFSACVVVA